MAFRKPKTYRRAVTRRRGVNRVARPWSKEEIAFMRKFYRRYETAWVARQLGRTVYSVRYKAVDLCIKKASPSIWKGNRGASNEFRRFAPNFSRSRQSWGKTNWNRKTKRTRTYRANKTRRAPRRTIKRRVRR